jgi:short-subunit dehydrogenase
MGWIHNILVGISVLVLSPILALAEIYARVSKHLPNGKKWSSCKGKKIVITGASSGMGQHLAEAFATEGAHLLICARRLKEVQQTAEKCLKLGAASATALEVDVSDENQCKNFAKKASELFDGRVDAIVLNAGISMGEMFANLENCQVIKNIMEVNYFGCVYNALYFLPMLSRSTQARIVVVSSYLGIQGGPTRTGYAASKFALKGFFESLSCELPKNVTVTMVYPGVINTEINRTRAGSLKLKTEDGMPAEEAAKIMKEAMKQGDEEVYFPAIMGYVLYHVRHYFPEFLKKAMTRKLMSLHDHK